ncbi:hypothetical protein TNIN_498891 [Trichonephila inaurata madagascariensis]|uniref:Uncharacterized protein n=1 Tax=Trichonephila inaurata madagascariensis TaxID=2747483 RepID=A0A8X6WPZ1_9ARAC|nr:hypothetical protein TNIN_498891 [Trichonephila inaurata madagascariensis]
MESEKNGVWERKRLEELRDGDSVTTPAGDISKQEIPEWFDEQKFQRAKEIYRDHFAATLTCLKNDKFCNELCIVIIPFAEYQHDLRKVS